VKNSELYEHLKLARALDIPKREEVLRRDHSVREFWVDNKNLLANAWKEWEECEKISFDFSSSKLIDEKLYDAVSAAWKTPEIKTENQVKDLLKEIAPGVYQFQLFKPEKLKELRDYLDKADQAMIPTRPPYGIVLNRKGAMLDRRSEGYLAAPSFQSLYQEILDKYMRPIARLLFPEVTDYDSQTFGFSIEYKPEKDTSIRMHTDASSVTLNINLNLLEESFTGSEVDFHDRETGQLKRVKFEPGVAIIHRGSVAHAAQPITSGVRTNLVLWLYGEQMQIPRNFNSSIEIDPKKRWSIPETGYDKYAPF